MNFKKENLSPSEIVKDLQEAVALLPESESWQDYFEGGTGRTIIELIAGSQAIKNHYNLMRVRESSLQVAKLDSSVTELAINKGVYRPPAKAHIIEVEFSATAAGNITRGQMVGSYKQYKVYALDNYHYKFGPGNKILVTVGFGERFEKEPISTSDFETFDVEAKFKYVADVLQMLTVNGDIVSLIDEEKNLYDPELKNSCLRIVYENLSRLVFGDGVIGRKLNPNDKVEYTYVSFGDDLLENFEEQHLNINLIENVDIITSQTMKRRASKYLDKERLRKIAMRHSIDGRWVQTEDYRNGILREYGEYIDDLLVADEYPSEEMYILPNKENWSDYLKEEISQLVDNKRGNATLVNIHYLDPFDENRLDISYGFLYEGPETDEELQKIIDEYVATKINKIKFFSYWVVGADIAVDLTNLAKGKFYGSLDDKTLIEPLQSIKNLNITFVR